MASAADVSLPQAYDWSGFYAGVNGGFAFGGDDRVAITESDGESVKYGRLSMSGGFGGLQAPNMR